MAYIDQKELLAKTDGGLQIIIDLYPEAEKCVGNNKLFKRRGEKTASTSLKMMEDGTWVVTDFGADSKPRNGISFYAWDQGKDFKQSLEELATRYGVDGAKVEMKGPDFNKREAKADEEEKSYSYDILEEWPDYWLKTLGPKVTAELALRVAKMHPLASYTYVKDRQAMTWSSREDYPIIMCDWGSFKKLYQPSAPDKGNRFRYLGDRPKDFINNLDSLVSFAEQKRQEQLNEYDPEDEDAERLGDFMFDEIFLASGERDALNIASLGYNVIWLNSETAKITGETYKKIMKYTKVLYNVPDLDETGKEKAHELALQYLDIHTLYLPDYLNERTDWRGRPRKDVTDWFEITDKHSLSKRFKNLIKDAFPYKFWEVKVKKEKNGYSMSYYISNVYLYNFLERCGFYRLRKEGEKNSYVFIQIVGNMVKQVEAGDVSDFVSNFLAERREDVKLRDYVYNSNRLNENSLAKLKVIEPDFLSYDKDHQYLFFEDSVWKVSAKGIEEYKPGAIPKFAWDNKIFKQKVERDNPYFEITEDDAGELDIKINRKDVSFLNFLIQTSRVHWQKELEEKADRMPKEEREVYLEKYKFAIDGPNLSDDEIYEQKLHLINKLFAIGYLLHRYKDMTRAWLVYAMDNKISEDGQSHGGSGKSIILNSALRQMYGQNDPNSQSSFYLSGRNPKLVDNSHLFDGVTKFTDYIIIDDANQHLKFDFFFSFITADLSVNPKNAKQFNIAFSQAPKFAITSNFPIRNMDPSSARRMLFFVTSDYYHFNKDGEYRQSREPKDEFGKQLIRDYDDVEMAEFYNLMAQALHFYLKHQKKVNPPMDNVDKRHFLAEMTDDFKAWADLYFDDTRLNVEISRQVIYDAWHEHTNKAKWATSNTFKKKIGYWCKYYNYTLNPLEMCNDQSGHRIIRTEDGKSKEMMYIKTNELKLSSNEQLDEAIGGAPAEPADF